MTLSSWVLKWILVLVAWMTAVPMYSRPNLLVAYLLLIFIIFSFMGVFGVVFEGKYIQRGKGFKASALSLLSCSSVQYSGARVGVALVVAIAIHRASLPGGFLEPLAFGIMFIVFFLFAGFDWFSTSRQPPRKIG